VSVRPSGDAARPLLGWILALPPLAAIAWNVAGMPSPIVLGALLPALCYAGLLLWIAYAGRIRVRPSLAAFALAWGAGVAAPAAALANDLVQARGGTGGWPFTVTGVPVLEEAMKAGVLAALIALWPSDVRGLRAGIVLGGLIGLGFGVAENVQYFLLARVQEGPEGLARAIAIRGFLEGAVHPVFAASTGAGLGLRRALPGVLGFGAAVAQHALWNGLASPAVSRILCNGVVASGACRGDPDTYELFVAVPLVVVVALAPGIVMLAALARRYRTGVHFQ
jgi:RsiW-degrading membrane proteinase PrsW (M82 family)